MASPAAARGGGDVSIQMAAAAADPAGGESQRRGSAAAKAEKSLNCFVRVLATVELVGNALGTLASLWASVVLIGSYRNSLEHVDFWISTVMIFIEAFRCAHPRRCFKFFFFRPIRCFKFHQILSNSPFFFFSFSICCYIIMLLLNLVFFTFLCSFDLCYAPMPILGCSSATSSSTTSHYSGARRH